MEIDKGLPELEQQLDDNPWSIPEGYIAIDLPSQPDKAPDECGVAAIIHKEVSPRIAVDIKYGLEEMQHRGQESAGIAVYKSEGEVALSKAPGLVPDALGEVALKKLGKGVMAIAHIRYGTVRGEAEKTPKAIEKAAQPTKSLSALGSIISLGHNGTLAYNDDEYSTDSHALSAKIADQRADKETLAETVIDVLKDIKGAYSLVIMGEDQIIGVRDPYGFRPLMLGSYANSHGGYALASESHALEAMGAQFRRELARGEMVVFSSDGRIESLFPFEKRPSRLCAMELIYLYGPQGQLHGQNVSMVRQEMGKMLAKEHPVEADIVIGVPESGIPAAEGFSVESGIPKVTGIIRSRYHSQRTFIIPGYEDRDRAVSKKLKFIMPEIHGRKVVVVDDSIVRGTTMRHIVRKLWEKGAKEVHLRIPSPPITHPCHYGMDFPDPQELIANQQDNDIAKVGEYLGVDSLAYLSIEGLYKATSAAGKLCLACMDGEYPDNPETNVSISSKK